MDYGFQLNGGVWIIHWPWGIKRDDMGYCMCKEVYVHWARGDGRLHWARGREVSHCSYATIPIGLELWIRSKLICWCWGESSARFIYTPRCITQYTFMNRKCIERLRCMGLLINNKTTQSTYAAVNHFGAYYDSRRPKWCMKTGRMYNSNVYLLIWTSACPSLRQCVA